jgi:hypothetical protein
MGRCDPLSARFSHTDHGPDDDGGCTLGHGHGHRRGYGLWVMGRRWYSGA